MHDLAHSASWHEESLSDLNATLQRLTTLLNANGITEDVRRSAAYDLHQIDSALSHQTLDDVLVASEALATLTGPSALMDGDVQRIHTLARTLATTWEAMQEGAEHTVLMAVATTNQPLPLRAVLNVPVVQTEINHIVELLGALAEGQPTVVGVVVPSRRRIVIPAFILAAILSLFLFLGVSLAVSTSRIAPTKRAVNILPTETAIGSGGASPTTAVSTTPVPGTTATPVPGTTATPAPGTTATPAPGATATATPVPALVVVTPSSIQLCPDNTITITYQQGQGTLTWTATPSDSTNIGVHVVDGSLFASSISGTLTPGQSVDVVVKALNDGIFNGTVTISLSGSATQHVTYYTNC